MHTALVSAKAKAAAACMESGRVKMADENSQKLDMLTQRQILWKARSQKLRLFILHLRAFLPSVFKQRLVALIAGILAPVNCCRVHLAPKKHSIH